MQGSFQHHLNLDKSLDSPDTDNTSPPSDEKTPNTIPRDNASDSADLGTGAVHHHRWGKWAWDGMENGELGMEKLDCVNAQFLDCQVFGSRFPCTTAITITRLDTMR